MRVLISLVRAMLAARAALLAATGARAQTGFRAAAKRQVLFVGTWFLIFGSVTTAHAWKMESAQVTLTDTTVTPAFTSVSFRQTYDTVPLVFALPTNEGSEPSALRIRNVTTTGFEIAQVEPPGNDGRHASMTIHYLAIEPGVNMLPDGTIIEAGSISTTTVQHGTGVGGGEGWDTVNFSTAFSTTPAVLAHIQGMVNESNNPPTTTSIPWLTTAVQNVTSSSVQLALERSEVDDGGGGAVSSNETIAYLAVNSGLTGTFTDNGGSTIAYEIIRSADNILGWDNGCYTTAFSGSYSAAPLVIATENTHDGGDGGWMRRCSLSVASVGLTEDEDTDRDSERAHTSERAGIVVFSQAFDADFPDPTRVGYYALDETSWNGTAGEVFDGSGRGNHGVAVGGAQTVADGRVCRAGATVNEGEAINTGVDVNSAVGDRGTVTFWFRPNWTQSGGERNQARVIFDASFGNKYFKLAKLDNQNNVYPDNGARRRLALLFEDSADADFVAYTSSEVGFTNGTWIHLAVTWDFPGDRFQIYVDGNLAANQSINTNGSIPDLDTLYLGDERSGNNQYGVTTTANGTFDEVRIWNTVRNQIGIQADMNATHACAPPIDHWSISHVGSGVACVDQAITITAHDASHNPVDANGLLVNLSTSNVKGSWTAILAGGGVLTDAIAGDGAATYQFAPGANSAQLAFRYANLAATSEIFGFNVSGGGFSETTGAASAADDPSFTLSQAGFRFLNVTDGNATIPTQISGKPSDTGFNSKTLRVQAIRTDTATGSCAGLFASQSRTVDLGAECNNPGTCAGGQVSINAAGIATSNDNAAAGAAAYTGVSLSFNAGSEADAVIAYPDAGQISLHARYDLDPLVAGFEAIGSSNAFVVRPFGLAFPGVNHSSTSAGGLIGAAGDNFVMTVQAYQWVAGEDANDDGVPDTGVNITDNGDVPNFAATATVGVAGNLPGVAPGAVARGAGCANPASVAMAGGAGTAGDWCYSEAGNVLLTADVLNYLAPGVDLSGNSGLDGDAAGGYVGRFKPKHFVATGTPTLTNREALACASTFTYMDEGLRLGFTLEARNAQNALTQNYTGAYAKLNLASMASLGFGARSGATNLTPRVDNGLVPGGSFANGVANLTAVTGIRRAAPDNPDGPFPGTQFGIAPNDNDPDAAGGVQMQSFDLDVDGVGGNDHLAIAPATELRFGQLSLDNAYGPVSQALPIPIETQYWNGGAFVTNTLDSCTTLARANIALAFSGALSACETAVQQASIAFSAGSATLTLSAPGTGNTGAVLLTPQLGAAVGTYCPASPGGTAAATASPAVYLLGRWNDAVDPDANGSTSYDDKPSGQAGFGLYGSQPRNFIFFRENY